MIKSNSIVVYVYHNVHTGNMLQVSNVGLIQSTWYIQWQLSGLVKKMLLHIGGFGM